MYLSNDEVKKFDLIMQEIAFKKISIDFDFMALDDEFADWLQNFDTNNLPHFYDPFGNDFQLEVAGLWDRIEDPLLAGKYFYELQSLPGYKTSSGPTELIKYFPKTCLNLKNLTGLVRAKLSRLPPNVEVPWHEHESQLTNRNIVLHIPIKTNSSVIYEVKIKENIFQSTFEKNNFWLFASYPNMQHRVYNHGNEDRWNLWMNLCVIRHDNLLVNKTIYEQIINYDRN
jgi:hypothetical protein